MQTASPTATTGPVEAVTITRSVAERKIQIVGLVCVVLTALGWGLNWPATKLLLAVCPPLSARGAAGLMAGAVLLGVAAWRGERLIVPRHLWGRLAIAALLNVSAWMGLTTASMLWLPAGQAATLAYTMPVWTALLAWPMLGERPTARQAGAIVLGLSGVLTAVGGRGFQLDIAQGPGVILALSAAVLFALGTVLSKRASIPLPRVALTAWQVALGCVPLLAGGFLFEDVNLSAMPMIGWIALIYTASISMGLCYLLWFAAVRRLKTSSATLGTLLTPIIGVAASTLVLGDPLSIAQAMSLCLVGGAIILSIRD